MKRKICMMALSLGLMIIFCWTASASMSSNNYKIKSMVSSCGGGPMGSVNYLADSTTGQPTPIPSGNQSPGSLNYTLYPGFWYTVGEIDICECDLNDDGNCDMLDWLKFGVDWGRTDCPVF
jgi:hypothetical protein